MQSFLADRAENSSFMGRTPFVGIGWDAAGAAGAHGAAFGEYGALEQAVSPPAWFH
jgi:hypothetical protein